MTANEIRNSFLKFFEGKGHTIVPSAPVIPYDDPTLLFTNAGMNQFKDIFLGTGKRDYTRVADSQKCIRVSGKHNDLEEVGRDTYHHTFFEMLGNWSFGDYYKKEAITWAWELLTEVWKLPKDRLWATVYKTDDEAEECWKQYTDINPSHVLRFGEKDNFWEMGETGPCGPCSEIHMDYSEQGNIDSSLINAGSPDAIEIWNLVFIQYNSFLDGDGPEILKKWDESPKRERLKLGFQSRDEIISKYRKLDVLPTKHVDTGMGFDRVVAILQGKRSNYDTDLFQPIIDQISAVTGQAYLEHNQVPMRAIADHVRMLTFAIADGATPSNDGRGYVLRRILRRAARFGRELRVKEPFIYKIVQPVVSTMGEFFPEIAQRQEYIQRIIRSEEEAFSQTLDTGIMLFDRYCYEAISRQLQREGRESEYYFEFDNDRQQFLITRLATPNFRLDSSQWDTDTLKRMTSNPIVISGEDTFRLYDTYGFPPDLTQLMADERGLRVDMEGFAELMEKQRARSQKERRSRFMAGLDFTSKEYAIDEESEKARKSTFLYDVDSVVTRPISLPFWFRDRENRDRGAILLEETTFYAESGGQVSDTGTLSFFNDSDKINFNVIDVVKEQEKNVHVLEASVEDIENIIDNYQNVRTQVDVERRREIMKNHTATHIVHEALRRVLGTHLHQQGSLVAPDHLRFDFNHFKKVSADELRTIEDIVNERIQDNIKVYSEELPIDKARRIPSVKMFFGDKYGDMVRVVFVDEKFSVEFCGGTHVKETRDIGLFKIISESSIARGTRRIEAVTGKGIDEYIEKQLTKRAGELNDEITKLINEKEELEKQLGTHAPKEGGTAARRPSLGEIKVEKPTLGAIRELESSLEQQQRVVEQLAEETKSLRKDVSKKKVREEVSNIDKLLLGAIALDGFKIVSAKVDASTMDELKSIADSLRTKIGSGVGVLGAVVDDKVAIVCVVTDDVIKEKHLEAGKIVGAVAKIVGGGGGGRPHLATAGGKDIKKLDEALKSTSAIVKSLLT